MSGAATSIAVSLRREAFELDVELDWDERVAVIFGPSGSGKSTLFEVLLGLHPQARARVRLADTWLEDPEQGLRLPTEQRRLGWVPQDPLLFPHLTVGGNLRFAAARSGDAQHDALARAVEVLEIGALLERSVDQLSGGEKQRVAIARALAAEPRALLMDEPLAALDLSLRSRVLPYLLRVRDELEIPLLYITHDPDEAMLVGEVVVVLDRGREVAAGAPREVLWSRAVLPLSEALGMENLLDGIVVEARQNESTVVADGTLELVVPVALARGENVRLGLRAEDIVLSVDEPGRISARNVFRATVAACEPHGGNTLVHLDAGVRLVARITSAAAERLALSPGAPVYAVIKAQALRRVA